MEVVEKRWASHQVFDLGFPSCLFGWTRSQPSQAGATLRVEQCGVKGVASGEIKLVGDWGLGKDCGVWEQEFAGLYWPGPGYKQQF